MFQKSLFNPLNAELNPISHLLLLLGDRNILHVSRIRVKIKVLLKSEKNKGNFTWRPTYICDHTSLTSSYN